MLRGLVLSNNNITKLTMHNIIIFDSSVHIQEW